MDQVPLDLAPLVLSRIEMPIVDESVKMVNVAL